MKIDATPGDAQIRSIWANKPPRTTVGEFYSHRDSSCSTYIYIRRVLRSILAQTHLKFVLQKHLFSIRSGMNLERPARVLADFTRDGSKARHPQVLFCIFAFFVSMPRGPI